MQIRTARVVVYSAIWTMSLREASFLSWGLNYFCCLLFDWGILFLFKFSSNSSFCSRWWRLNWFVSTCLCFFKIIIFFDRLLQGRSLLWLFGRLKFGNHFLLAIQTISSLYLHFAGIICIGILGCCHFIFLYLLVKLID